MTLFEPDDRLTVAQLSKRITSAIKRSFPTDVWVQGQIRNLSRSSRGHVYFDLIDPVAAGSAPKASLSATLFDSNRQVVNRILNRAGNAVRIDDGVEVRVRGTVQLYHPRGQLQLNVTSIDPEYTLGRLSADRDQLLKLLAERGLVEANASLAMALVPLQIALITSAASAAEADFLKQLESSGYAFSVRTIGSRVQGEFASQEIADAIALAQRQDFDVIAVVRGGGSRTDLAAFDSEIVALAITDSSIPVVCGIGHEIDSSVADIVAHASFKTPTACAQYLIERVIAFDFALAERAKRLVVLSQTVPLGQLQQISEVASAIATSTSRALVAAEASTNYSAAALAQKVDRTVAKCEATLRGAHVLISIRAGSAIANANHALAHDSQRLDQLARHALASESGHIEVLDARIKALDPLRALGRGYSITTVNRRLVRSVSSLGVGDVVSTRFVDGTAFSKVTETAVEPALAVPTKE